MKHFAMATMAALVITSSAPGLGAATGTKDIVALFTTDGNAAITNGRLEVVWRGTR